MESLKSLDHGLPEFCLDKILSHLHPTDLFEASNVNDALKNSAYRVIYLKYRNKFLELHCAHEHTESFLKNCNVPFSKLGLIFEKNKPLKNARTFKVLHKFYSKTLTELKISCFRDEKLIHTFPNVIKLTYNDFEWDTDESWSLINRSFPKLQQFEIICRLLNFRILDRKIIDKIPNLKYFGYFSMRFNTLSDYCVEQTADVIAAFLNANPQLTDFSLKLPSSKKAAHYLYSNIHWNKLNINKLCLDTKHIRLDEISKVQSIRILELTAIDYDFKLESVDSLLEELNVEIMNAPTNIIQFINGCNQLIKLKVFSPNLDIVHFIQQLSSQNLTEFTIHVCRFDPYSGYRNFLNFSFLFELMNRCRRLQSISIEYRLIRDGIEAETHLELYQSLKNFREFKMGQWKLNCELKRKNCKGQTLIGTWIPHMCVTFSKQVDPEMKE